MPGSVAVEVFANFARGTTDTYLQKHSNSRLGAGIRRSDAAPPDSRCTSPEQKKIRRTGRIFFCGGGALNPIPPDL